MSRIDKDQVKYVANLARLSFTDEEIETFTTQLDDIIGFAEQLNELNTDGIEPTTHVRDMYNVMREDVVEPSLPREEALKNAPEQEDGQIKVPQIMSAD
ncbi:MULTISPECIES: Asp-tRNA(Asn)/Glu-tRNA(Gln) amidotransferase subunit GatC [Sporolactobacillus]|jgi:aspartyl-tRNA(Asn)/glutamyl-tRNA(Gln) amidotransferase subunit C|uniref:Aspartyl/glutamyl-tRNA(Asn/Gln) amidotransferase subunit C n=3 Tax=Sporolactobacillus TaxID=2077 RepID=A0A4Y1ZER0_9BACL|nr:MULTISPECIES: Asp-tRNA(Asn)/Glu-tRNA(Gln) amidotransferase subunit GatC [Sporolactobacillus]KLI02958.1 glutamyl-tRNA amidotransferase [Sporolactobacillus inulinus CASD]QAA23421.1 Asp-tRNA(Asn)/Glu-tRNA(Gln) amidotransferase subunit GatC [Sporolactobacillus terrae]QAA26391.1 Asp-tRNA(Asn)/Glu-tRNA(Gln) amidotransferase subunit GatC [Sporolactobacillus terrae]UAK15486.1 Asp-tRNA(Asn)/Glu-tRNA(Gln) amidotransferase subunit GatC [Sporolactobacillus terrae]GAY77607.1 aspartyl-tRNA(Asn) amidotran